MKKSLTHRQAAVVLIVSSAAIVLGLWGILLLFPTPDQDEAKPASLTREELMNQLVGDSVYGIGYPEAGPELDIGLEPGEKFDDGHAKLVLVIDDFGYQFNSEPVYGILTLDIPVTIAIIPGTWASKKIANLAAKYGKEVIIHFPMQPDHDDPHMEKIMLSRGMGSSEIDSLFDTAIESVPGAIGVNNHMGSGVTQDRSLMAEIARLCSLRGLWILDSITHPKSVLYAEAVNAGVPAARRDVFLDHENDPEKVREALYHAVQVSRKKGRPIIVIGHPRPVTWAVLKEEVPLLREQGVEWLPLSEIVKI